MTDLQQAHGTSEQPNASETDERRKVAARCSECDAIYPAWVLADDSISPIGRGNDCRCGVLTFRVLSNTAHGDPVVSYEESGGSR